MSNIRKADFSPDLLRYVDGDGEYFTVKATGKSGMSHRGLARFTGKHHTTIGEWVSKVREATLEDNQLPEPLKPFAGKRLTLVGYEDKEGRNILEDTFCSALIEYFAFHAPDRQKTEKARTAFRLIRDVGMRQLIHIKTGWKSQEDFGHEYSEHKQRLKARISLKDEFRVELMTAVRDWQKRHKASRKIFWQTHDAMNKRIQGLLSKEIKQRNNLTVNSYIRDHYETRPLIDYSAINRLATNFVSVHDMNPVDAVNQACELYLLPGYTPHPLQMVENVFKADKRLKTHKKIMELPPKARVTQLSFF